MNAEQKEKIKKDHEFWLNSFQKLWQGELTEVELIAEIENQIEKISEKKDLEFQKSIKNMENGYIEMINNFGIAKQKIIEEKDKEIEEQYESLTNKWDEDIKQAETFGYTRGKSEENRRCKIHKGNDEPVEFCTFCINERVSEAVIEARRVERNILLSEIEKIIVSKEEGMYWTLDGLAFEELKRKFDKK